MCVCAGVHVCLHRKKQLCPCSHYTGHGPRDPGRRQRPLVRLLHVAHLVLLLPPLQRLRPHPCRAVSGVHRVVGCCASAAFRLSVEWCSGASGATQGEDPAVFHSSSRGPLTDPWVLYTWLSLRELFCFSCLFSVLPLSLYIYFCQSFSPSSFTLIFCLSISLFTLSLSLNIESASFYWKFVICSAFLPTSSLWFVLLICPPTSCAF